MALKAVSAAIGPGGYVGGFAISKSDTVDTPKATRAVYVGGAGSVVVTMNDGSTPITFAAVPAGALLEISVTRVLNATTATNLVGLY